MSSSKSTASIAAVVQQVLERSPTSFMVVVVLTCGRCGSEGKGFWSLRLSLRVLVMIIIFFFFQGL